MVDRNYKNTVVFYIMDEKVPLSQTELYESILFRIRNGIYAPGEKLSENFLATEFNCSRMPVRETLKHLEQDGLVTIQPKSGTYVRAYSVKEIVDALEIRAYLESLTFTLLIQQDIDLRPLEANLYYMEQLAERPNFDLNEFGQSHLNFHTEMVQLSGNTFLVGLYDRMHLGALQRIFFYPMTYDELQMTHNEHCKIFDYIKTKNPEGEAFIKQHLWKLRDSIATSDVLSHM